MIDNEMPIKRHNYLRESEMRREKNVSVCKSEERKRSCNGSSHCSSCKAARVMGVEC